MVKKCKIAILLYDQVNAVDVTGPMEVFSTAKIDGQVLYDLETWALDGLSVKATSGLRLCADRLLPSDPAADLLLVPGGTAARSKATMNLLGPWLATHQSAFPRIASICTGAFLLAGAGLLDGRRVATHWLHCPEFRRLFPNVVLEEDKLFVADGPFLSSGGVASGIDLALDIVEHDFGGSVAINVARDLVLFLRRTGNQSQFSGPLRLQSLANDRMSDLCKWIANNLDQDLTVERLAERASMSTRHFTRTFSESFGEPPATYIKNMRLDVSRAMLEQGTNCARAARQSGFLSTDGFRRAFEKRFGVSPSEYQNRFSLSSASDGAA